MALEISLSPTLYEVFHRLKTYMDSSVYDTNETAIPRFNVIYLNGTGATIGEVMNIVRNEDVVMQVLASSGGTFSVEIPILFDQSNTFQVYGSTSGYSNIIVFDVYQWLMMHYLFSLQFKEVLTRMGQAKQDLYVDSKVGDAYTTTGDPSYFETETDVYETSRKALVDKMTLPIPSDYWCKDIKEAVKKAIAISEKGPVQASLQALKVLYESVGLEKIFTFQWEYPVWWDSAESKIPRIKAGFPTTLVIPAGKKVRVGHSYKWVTVGAKEIIFSAVPSGTYYWVYVDGEKDIDDTLEVKTSSSQPIPGYYKKTVHLTSGDVSSDDAVGTVTGIPYQSYITLEPPLASMTSSISISDGGGDIENYTIVSREIIALGRANMLGTLDVTYEYWMDSTILCVLRFGVDCVTEMMRTWAMPNHIRPQSDIHTEMLEIYFHFTSGLTVDVRTAVLNNISNILKAIVPITIYFEPYVNMGNDDQDHIEEDGLFWSGIWKGYVWLPVYVPYSKRENYEKTDI